MKNNFKNIDYAMVLAMLVVLLGCAGYSSTRSRGPDGMDGWFLIDCRSTSCAKLAEQMCPGGYLKANEWTVVENHTQHPAAVQNKNQLFLRCK